MRTEKRAVERFAYPARIEYQLDAGPPDKVQNGVTINISHAGLGLYAFARHEEGQEIVITTALPVYHRRAKITWIMHEHDCMYKMGVQFINGAVPPDKKPGQA